MKTALITTTVNVPRVLELYRAHGPGVDMFVAGDERTLPVVADFCKTIYAHYYSLEDQKKRYPELSERVGPNTVARRNFALLEALKFGADIIITVDDDNFPMAPNYFEDATYPLMRAFTGLQVRSYSRWFDVGRLLDPPAPHRGFPLEVQHACEIEHVIQAKIGTVAGVCLGDPDISAITRISRHPVVHRGSELLASGVVVAPGVFTVFNSQNTAFRREIAPAFLMLPQVGRYDDILASIIAQRIMFDRNTQVYFGRPFVWQQRNIHNLVKDLKLEMWGYENIWSVACNISRLPIDPDLSVVESLRTIFRVLAHQLPAGCLETANAWLDACEEVL